MKTTQRSFTCTVIGARVTRIRFYAAIGGIGEPGISYEMVGEQCSYEMRCPHLVRCPMREAGRVG